MRCQPRGLYGRKEVQWRVAARAVAVIERTMARTQQRAARCVGSAWKAVEAHGMVNRPDGRTRCGASVCMWNRGNGTGRWSGRGSIARPCHGYRRDTAHTAAMGVSVIDHTVMMRLCASVHAGMCAVNRRAVAVAQECTTAEPTNKNRPVAHVCM